MDIRSTGRGTGLVHPVDTHVGLKMRELRVLNGISQETIADRLSVSFQQIQKYETGRNRISASRLYELAVLFGVSVDHFYDGMSSETYEAVCDAVGVKGDPSHNNETNHTGLSQMTDRQTLILMQQFSEIKSYNIRRRITELVRGLAHPDNEDEIKDKSQQAAA